MRFTNFAIVKFSLFLTLGVLTASAKIISLRFAITGLIVCLFLFTLFWMIARRQLVQEVYFGINSYLIFFLIGIVHFMLNEPQNIKMHFSHEFDPDTYSMLDLKVAELLKSNPYNDNYIAEVIGMGNSTVSGKVLLQIKKDSTHHIDHTIDDRLLVSAKIIEMKSALNPGQFDYSKYMRNKGVYHQVRILPRDILQCKKGRTTIRGSADRIRSYIINKVLSNSRDKDEFSIFKALVLGDRTDIGRELYSQYINAGAVHILAVSGLHVGLIYLMLLLVLKPIEKIPYGTLLMPLIIIIGLWGYAYITGLSESVIRSVTMFSLFAFAKFLHRRTNTINVLFISYFILVLITPIRLFRVGFQLSFLAVFFILWIQPLIYTWYRPRYYLDRLFWGIISVSLAAQLGILPLSLYYFHRFPGLFLITNIAVLPFLGLLLGGGFIIIFLSVLNILPGFVSDAYWLMIELTNNFIDWVATNDHFIVENIHFSLEKTLFSYLFLIDALLVWKTPNYRNTMICLSSLILLTGIFIVNKIENSGNELVIFHKTGQTNMAFLDSGKCFLYQSDPDHRSTFDHIIQPYLTSKNIRTFTEIDLPYLFFYGNNLVYTIDSIGIYPKEKKPDWIILTNNPKVNLERIICWVEPRLIVADGNNWKSLIERWKSTCAQYDIPFYSTYEMGAFINP